MIFQNKSKDKKLNINSLGFNELSLKNMLSPVHMDIKSNLEVVLEGCKYIEEYDENIVKIKVPKMEISFFGRNLEIKCMNTDSLVIEGVLTSIEFNS